MKEDFLHYVWQYKLFDSTGLTTTAGENVTVLIPGKHNKDSGPDFFNSKIILENTIWVGNVEIHWCASEWERHGHQLDRAYDNVVLHVVYEDDGPVFNQAGEKIPTIVLRGRISQDLIYRYQSFLAGQKWIPCAHMIHEAPRTIVYAFLHRMTIDKLEDKSQLIFREWERNRRNWEQTFYEFLSRNFGFSVNALPFQLLAQSVPLNVLLRHSDRLDQIEALLFGQAGFLESAGDDPYAIRLCEEYKHLRKKYQLDSLNVGLWKFSRMRPANFPTLRIAQLAALLKGSQHLFSDLMQADGIPKLRKILDVSSKGFWKNHYLLNKRSVAREKSLGDGSIDNLLINTVIPFLFVYGKYRKDEKMSNRALSYLEVLEPEKNQVIRKWGELGVKAHSAMDTQGLIHLKKRYCLAKKCLNCSIGNSILRR